MRKIKTIEIPEYYCDRCGEKLQILDNRQPFSDADVWDAHDQAGWQEIDGEHYCSNCWTTDDNDNIVPLPAIEPQK